MKKGIILVLVGLLLAVPMASAVPQTPNTVEDTTTIRCTVDGQTIEKELSETTIQDLIDMGESLKEEFLTIYDKTTSDEEVTIAFDNIHPFFQALVDYGLTDKTVAELTAMYQDIREKIREPQVQSISNPEGPQPLGLWNGVPTPVWGNVMCGIFDVGTCAGFALGTHTFIPTIGIDAFITYAFTGTSTTVGMLGGTFSVAAFQVIFGFVGVLIATPLIMIGPYFMTGLCGAMIGIGA